MKSLFIQLSCGLKSQFREIDPYDWFCGPGSHFNVYLKRLLNHISFHIG